ncbi:hypothetical protein OIE61_41105 [Streptomyces sp. NBC_01762]|uniref:hypothetical protein n=1 Tax=unclassified Streptomyces TaxID=2593676 RepID=UPI002DDA104B|nr:MULTISPECIES: hypothetical protein [unclassified Streptomyces]WSC49783.1 hypothetical protein OIE61_41105 [Streptomyces sp. NBC_01762]WSD29360.1 hypothetical protein OHA26_41460 [Streptomyces sp. NBC_01751]WSJ48767.1 hypothetical protein OG243_03595 [Streptomyces sp. NBC_01318]
MDRAHRSTLSRARAAAYGLGRLDHGSAALERQPRCRLVVAQAPAYIPSPRSGIVGSNSAAAAAYAYCA